ncbi:MAG: DUF1802 family protein [Thermoleophilia bacterium]|nr:DUF1802 family protein [Thermoleophilia bacterium]MDH3725419.1 DUF1802 family protein [Thermoleophilia bacterium]
MPEHALKEWAVTCDALLAGEQVLIVRKGGIGEKKFELPHPRFFLFPTYAHQRPDLVKREYRDRFGDTLERREEPTALPLAGYAEIAESHPIGDPAALDAIDHLHILSSSYARERLRWRPKQPLWAVVLRVWRLDPAPTLAVTDEHAGCVSWVELPTGFTHPHGSPALDDDSFAGATGAVRDALAIRASS